MLDFGREFSFRTGRGSVSGALGLLNTGPCYELDGQYLLKVWDGVRAGFRDG